MQFDFAVPANGAQRIEVSGTFFKYKSGTGPIRVTTSKGGYLDLMPGQGVSSLSFSGLSVQDRSGGANAGVILAGAFEFKDDTINGAIALAEPYLSVNQNQRDYLASLQPVVTAGQYSVASLYNPVGSGRLIVVDRLSFSIGGPSTPYGVNVAVGATIPTTLTTAGIVNKRAGGGVPVGAKISGDNVAQPSTNGMSLVRQIASQVNTFQDYLLSRPIVLPAGQGLMVSAYQLAASMTVNFEFSEVSQ
jgi:hypothetical protein